MTIEAKGLFKILKERREYLYHFTDSRNIESIKKDGILSLAMIKKNGMSVCFGGNEISHEQDKIIGMDDYVHLSFTRSHPMIKSAKDSGRILVVKNVQIAAEVLENEGILFADGVANSNSCSIFNWEKARTTFDWQAIYDRLDWKSSEGQKRRKTVEKYEILVPKIIIPKYLVW